MAIKTAPYGSWKSPVTTDLIVGESITISDSSFHGQDVFWSELRPREGGRNVVVRLGPDGQATDMTPGPFNVRTRVHEYGGGAYAVGDGEIYFANFSDQRVYRQPFAGEPTAITPEGRCRFADFKVDQQRNRLIAVREDHSNDGEPVSTIVSLDLAEGGEGDVLTGGNDFYSSPRLSPDGDRVAWLTWNHPNMPWDGTELWIDEFDQDGMLSSPRLVAGGRDESIYQPEWSRDGTLYFVSDRTGWWNLYRWSGGQVEPLWPMEAEFGEPQWLFGGSTYAFESANLLICAYFRNGEYHLAQLNTTTLETTDLNTPYTIIRNVRAAPSRVLFIGGSPTEPLSLVHFDLSTRQIDVLRRSASFEIDTGYVSQPEEIEFPTENELTAFGFYYPPQNKDYSAPQTETPPLLVMSHGGPTSAVTSSLNPSIQYWTSRGIAVLDVNYGGSTGHGRQYRQRLNGQWGIVDVDDCINGALFLAKRGDVDSEGLAIRGGSAGGYTTLAALTFRDVFKAGASYYGVSDLETLAKDTHKFESRYLDQLIGPYPAERDLYRQRSPIHFTDQLSCPLILLQGLEDKVVPPDQAEKMFDAVRAKGLPVAYVAFPDEQHGFRNAQNIKRSLEAEFYFYSRVFGFEMADTVEPVEIENLV